MKLSITARLTLTTAILTFVVFASSGIVLYTILAAGIRTDATRRAEDTVKQLAFGAMYQWEGLLDQGAEQHLAIIRLNAPDWALVRGGGQVVTAKGIFVESHERVATGVSRLLSNDRGTYRVASTPLFAAPSDSLDELPEHLLEAVRRESPEGTFLRSKLEVQSHGRVFVELLVLESNQLLELELTYGGELIDSTRRPLVAALPEDLTDHLRIGAGLVEFEFREWRALHGQLLAIVDGLDESGAATRVAVTRLGELFHVSAVGTELTPIDDSRLWVVGAFPALDEMGAIRRLQLAVALGFPGLWALVILVGWFVTRQAMSPVQKIVDTLEAIEVTSLDHRLPIRNVQDELDRISLTINGMLQRIQSGFEREQQFVGDASHELRSPIAKVLADIEVALSKERTPSEYRETLRRCRSYAIGMRRLVESLLSLARLEGRTEGVRIRDFDLTDVAADVIRTLPADQASRVEFDCAAAETVVTARGAPELIRVLLHNLLDNALRHTPADSRVALRLATRSGHATVTVDDHGVGIPEDQLERVFSRFFRLDKVRSRETGGFGLGLSIVNEVARAHNTRVSLQNRPEGGLRATIVLPAMSPADDADE